MQSKFKSIKIGFFLSYLISSSDNSKFIRMIFNPFRYIDRSSLRLIKSTIKILQSTSNFLFYCRHNLHTNFTHGNIAKPATLANTANLKPNIYRDVISPFVVSRLEHPLLRSTGDDFSPILHQNDHFRGRIQRFRTFLVPEPRFYRHIIPRWLRLFQRPDVNKIVKSGWIGVCSTNSECKLLVPRTFNLGLLSVYRRLNKLNFIQGKLVNEEETVFEKPFNQD